MNKNHPQIHNIIGQPKEQLLNRKKAVEYALFMWRKETERENREYNLKYFSEELDLINKELKRFTIKSN